ncbi:MAG TPA: fumarylacetoacetate hydrolase family protein [Rhodanobacteraceae bacterium]
MFVVHDHRVQLAGERLPRDVRAAGVLALDAEGARFDVPDVHTVYGTLLNDRRALAALDESFHAAPYHHPPQAPILYVKPRNTLVGHGARVRVPAGATGVRVGASLGIVLGRVACHIDVAHALDYVAGFTPVADLSVPHASWFRLPPRDVIADGFCVVGPAIVAARDVANPNAVTLDVSLGAHRVYSASTATCVRGVARLLADVTEFMTLVPGDVLTLGVPWGAPVAHAGDRVGIEVQGWPPLRFQLAAGVAA